MKKLFFFAAALMVSSAAMAVHMITVNQANSPTGAAVKAETATTTALDAGVVLLGKCAPFLVAAQFVKIPQRACKDAAAPIVRAHQPQCAVVLHRHRIVDSGIFQG